MTATDGAAENPAEVGRPSGKGPTRLYETKDIALVWDATLRMPATAVLFALLAAMVVHEGQRLPAERYEEV